MPITAKLFAQIENDAVLSGIYGLHGNSFVATIAYLNEYFEQLKKKKEHITPEYLQLMMDLKYTETVYKSLDKCTQDAHANPIAESIGKDLNKLKIGEKLLIPGGWRVGAGGHAMLYQFSRVAEGYIFTVINSGGGIDYHSKKSSQEKELYNPKKMWRIPLPATDKGKAEIRLFIGRLLKARIAPSKINHKKPVDEKVLYQTIIDSISHTDAQEIDADKDLAQYVYTGGQLSGSCTQRVLHQMLKINSRSVESYQRFIFKFKLHALFEYVSACKNKKEPFNQAVADQIYLAIDNNLKILNIPNLFTSAEFDKYFAELTELKNTIRLIPFDGKTPPKPPTEHAPGFYLADRDCVQAALPVLEAAVPQGKSIAIRAYNGMGFLERLVNTVQDIKNLEDPVVQYVQLEKLILSLPLDSRFPELNGVADYLSFQEQINNIQDLLHNLREKLLKEAQIPTFNHLCLSMLALEEDAYTALAKLNKEPSFAPFTLNIGIGLIGNHERDPFEASNSPIIDTRIIALKERFKSDKQNLSTASNLEYIEYYKLLLATEPELTAELKKLYSQKYDIDASKLHKEIRANGAEALHMVFQHLFGDSKLASPARFTKIIEKVKAHFVFELRIIRSIRVFFGRDWPLYTGLHFTLYRSELDIGSPLLPIYVPYQSLSISVTKHKYNLKDSPARDALEADISRYSSFRDDGEIIVKTENKIQLTPTQSTPDTQKSRVVAMADIAARDYYHLRRVPDFQIALTLDYFTRHINRLDNEDNQRYVEANIFQPGLLLTALRDQSFLPQLDRFLKTGKRYFAQSGQHTRESLLFFRLDFLVSRYYAQMNTSAGIARLKATQEDLLKQLSLSTDPDVIYVLHQYLFLSLIQLIEQGDNSDKSFQQALRSYFYLMGHTNPLILEDSAHRFEVQRAIAQFKISISKKTDQQVKEVVKNALQDAGIPTKNGLKGTSPNYSLVIDVKRSIGISVLQGRFFEDGLARSGLPLAIQNHPLIKQLGLHQERECLINTDGTYMVLRCKEGKVYLFYKDNKLTVQKDWIINGKTERYELEALSDSHLAYQANKSQRPVVSGLPLTMTDGMMNYWKCTSTPDKAILTRANVPAYLKIAKQITTLDASGAETGYALDPGNDSYYNLLGSFESKGFIHFYKGIKNYIARLPRFGLSFAFNKDLNTFINPVTQEQIVHGIHPIHPKVLGLVLKGKEQSRVLVPIAQFYESTFGAEQSDFYPVEHDKSDVVAGARLQEYWKRNPPLYPIVIIHQDGRQYVSFQLRNGEPIAETAADALYLVYMYLATNQTEKAWKTLEDCSARLGGLKGDPNELKYISWICEDLPYIFPDKRSDYEKTEPVRNTPPYVACKLKAMSLVSDYLLQDRKFVLKNPDSSDGNAYTQYALLEYQQSTQFLDQLPQTIYNTYERLQRMDRHLPQGYRLATIERKRLLDYYQQAQPKGGTPLGALGYEWMQLSIESLFAEKETLLAQLTADKDFPAVAKERLEHIDKQLTGLKPVIAQSTELERVAIDLSLPAKAELNQSLLTQLNKEFLDSLQEKLVHSPGASSDVQGRALDLLSSEMDESDFVSNFATYLQIASSSTDLQKRLLDFCTKVLLANRHVPLTTQYSNIPLLCNILYRVIHWGSPLKVSSFDVLVNAVRYSLTPPIYVYQAKDVAKEILAKPDEFIQKRKSKTRTPVVPVVLPKQSITVQTGIDALLTDSLGQGKKRAQEIFANYRALEEKTLAKLETLGKTPLKNIEQRYQLEAEAGKVLLAEECQKKALAQGLLSDAELVAAIQKSATTRTTKLKEEADALWATALKLANQGPSDAELARVWKAEKSSSKRGELTQAELRSLYIQSDLSSSIEKTGLSKKDVQKLHDSIHKALAHGILHQSAAKVSERLAQAIHNKDLNSAIQALDVLTRVEIPALGSPAMVVIQHEENILLHKRQERVIREALSLAKDGNGFNEILVKVPMGGGKSKVVGPTVMEMKARGDNLVIFEVPQSLLETSHEDLNRISQRLYGKRAYRFDFNRDSNCSPDRLEQIYKQFVEIMTTRSYLVTTGEAMMSLELKFVEQLLSTTESKERDEQLFWLNKITSLVRHQGDSFIDEAHEGLAIKKRLNYSAPDLLPISVELIENAVALFKLIDPAFVKNAPNLSLDFNWTPFKLDLATKLICDPVSPLQQFVRTAVTKYGAQVEQELIGYLSNTANETSKAVLGATEDEMEILSFFKQEISVVLPQTLVRRHDENYGASKRDDLHAIERTLAIPYTANMIVNERSRFGNQLESINYTAQMMMIKGVSKELLQQRIRQWKVSAQQELFQSAVIQDFDQTPTAKGFAVLAGSLGLTLKQIDLNNAEQFEKLHAHFQHNQALIFNLLQEQALKQVKQEGETISSNAFNHVDLYRSVQGVCGTPWNYTTISQRLKYTHTTSLGSDGYVLELLHAKNTRVLDADFISLSAFIDEILSHSEAPERTRSIIDICARFQGINNLLVAQDIARYFRTRGANEIKHVLYFNEQQILCAIDINEPDKAIELKTSDEAVITRILGTPPARRFTYYDQGHSLGVDLVQDSKAHAIVLADEKTPLNKFLQGSTRMRGLALAQSMEIRVTKDLKGIKREVLFEKFVKVEQQMVLQENLTAAQLEMTSKMRFQAMELVHNVPVDSPAQQRKLAQAFKPFFATKPNTSLAKLYGALNKPKLAATILEEHKEQLNKSWAACAKAAGIKIKDQKAVLQEVIDKALPHCLKEYEASENGSAATEVEIQSQLQQQTQLQIAVISETYNDTLTEETLFAPKHMLSLNQVCALQHPSNLFSKELWASKNYANVYKGQKKYTGAFLKPVFLIWYCEESDGLHAHIVTLDDAKELSKEIQKGNKTNSWIATTEDTVVAGKHDGKIIESERYQILREQVRFFNGEFSSLLGQEARLHWLPHNTLEKLDLYEKQLLPYQPHSIESFGQLKTTLLQAKAEGYAYIAKHPYKDLSQFDWKTQFPGITPVQAMEYSRVAAAFAYIYKNGLETELSMDKLQKDFNLPIASLQYIDAHLKHLMMLKFLLKSITELHPKMGLVSSLKGNAYEFFETAFNVKLNELTSLCEDDRTVKRWLYAPSGGIDLKAIQIFSTHPALGVKAVELTVPMTKRAKSVADLCKILKLKFNTKLTDALFAELIKQIDDYYFDTSVALALVDCEYIADFGEQREQVWRRILTKPRTDAEMLTLADHILSKRGTNLPLFVIEFLFTHSAAGLEIKKRAAKALGLQTESFLKKFYKAKPNDVEGFVCIVEQGNLSTDLLKEYVSKVRHSKQLSALVSHPQATHAVMIAATDSPLFSSEIMQNILEKPLDFNDHLLVRLAEKCITEEMINLLIKKEELCNKIIPVLLKNPRLTEAHLLTLLAFPLINSKNVQDIYNHPLAGQKVKSTVVPQLTQDILLKFLREYQFIDTDDLMMVLEQPGHLMVTDLVSRILSDKSFTPGLTQKLIARNELSDLQLILIVEQLFERCSNLTEPKEILDLEACIIAATKRLKPQEAKKVLRGKTLSVNLGLALFDLSTELDTLPLKAMINASTDEQLEMLLNGYLSYSIEHLVSFAHRVKSAGHIDLLLTRTEMFASLADGLLDRSEYSGKIYDTYSWLTKAQALKVLNKTKDFNSFFRVLNHPCFVFYRDQWLAELSQKQQALSQEAVSSNDPKKKVLAAIEVLKVQSCSHMIISTNNTNYCEAARVGFNLYQKLLNETQQCFDVKTTNPEAFRTHCKQAIKDSESVLNAHRGYRQALVDILNVILALLTFRFLGARNPGHKWRFFEVDTNSMKTVKGVGEQILGVDNMVF